VRGPVNCTFTETKAGCYTALMNVVDPWVPLNSGSIEGIKVVAPLGCIVNPTYPAPVFSTTSDPLNKVYEAVMKAMSCWLPDRVTAGSYCTMNNCTASGDLDESGEEFIWYHFGPGGIGARLTKDGRNGDCHAMTNARTESMEIWETRYPVQFERLGLIMDSGGPGRYRGGLGVSRQIRVLAPTFLTGCADRHEIPPWGLSGGGDGKPNSFKLIRDGKEWDFPGLFGTLSGSKFTNVPLKVDDIFDIQSGGGGGYGDPMHRDIDTLVNDVEQGYISAEKAKCDYGVWINPDTGDVDRVKTVQLRLKDRRK
ncbi:hydantoinase B/oxoprolinase family protein, partial [SAR202 cluster bacterium AD-804-J14_MRT_500m]|nr:hydantoinase B/oxoprolinase family protein [SAR202 cluster bacterium AD-804-J14_MRT_500m]